MTKYVVKDECRNGYLVFSRFVRDLDIITIAEVIGNYNNATQFNNVRDADECLKELDNYKTYDASGCSILDVDELNKTKKEDAQKKADDIIKNAWSNSSEETKKKLLEGMSEEKRKKFLESVA